MFFRTPFGVIYRIHHKVYERVTSSRNLLILVFVIILCSPSVFAGCERKRTDCIGGARKENFLGGGTFGRVYKTRYGNTRCALKICFNDNSMDQEVKYMKRCADANSKYFLRVYDAWKISINDPRLKGGCSCGQFHGFWTGWKRHKRPGCKYEGKLPGTHDYNKPWPPPKVKEAYLIAMEMSDKELDTFIQSERERLELDDFIDMMIQVAKGIKVMHEKNVIHLDLKQENMLVKRSGNKLIVKIIDLGLAEPKRTSDGRRDGIRDGRGPNPRVDERQGTPGFRPSDVSSANLSNFNRSPSYAKIIPFRDFFAFGCIISGREWKNAKERGRKLPDIYKNYGWGSLSTLKSRELLQNHKRANSLYKLGQRMKKECGLTIEKIIRELEKLSHRPQPKDDKPKKPNKDKKRPKEPPKKPPKTPLKKPLTNKEKRKKNEEEKKKKKEEKKKKKKKKPNDSAFEDSGRGNEVPKRGESRKGQRDTKKANAKSTRSKKSEDSKSDKIASKLKKFIAFVKKKPKIAAVLAGLVVLLIFSLYCYCCYCTRSRPPPMPPYGLGMPPFGGPFPPPYPPPPIPFVPPIPRERRKPTRRSKRKSKRKSRKVQKAIKKAGFLVFQKAKRRRSSRRR